MLVDWGGLLGTLAGPDPADTTKVEQSVRFWQRLASFCLFFLASWHYGATKRPTGWVPTPLRPSASRRAAAHSHLPHCDMAYPSERAANLRSKFTRFHKIGLKGTRHWALFNLSAFPILGTAAGDDEAPLAVVLAQTNAATPSLMPLRSR